jgi:inorganic pyrophosphatase
MTREKEMLTGIVHKMIDNGVLDEIVAAVLESSLQDNLEDLEDLSKKQYLEAHHWQDYAECLSVGRALVRCLQYFTINNYEAETVKLNKYSLALETF